METQEPRKFDMLKSLPKRRELANMIYNNYGHLTNDEKSNYDNEVYAAYQGYIKALHDIEDELDTIKEYFYERAVIHLRDYIDNILGRNNIKKE